MPDYPHDGQEQDDADYTWTSIRKQLADGMLALDESSDGDRQGFELDDGLGFAVVRLDSQSLSFRKSSITSHYLPS